MVGEYGGYEDGVLLQGALQAQSQFVQCAQKHAPYFGELGHDEAGVAYR